MDMSEAWVTAHMMLRGFVASTPRFALAILLGLLFYLAGRVVRSIIERGATGETSHRTLKLALGRIAHGAIAIVGLLFAIAAAFPGFTPGNLVSALGIGGIAIGFAFKDIFENFLAGILILITRPFRIGDQIVYDRFEGTVEDIQARATWLRTYDGRRVLIPNSELFKNSVTVNTAFDRRRLEHDFRISASEDIERARAVILDVIRESEDVLAVPAPDVVVIAFDETHATLKARWWSPSTGIDVVKVRDRVLTAHLALTRAAG